MHCTTGSKINYLCARMKDLLEGERELRMIGDESRSFLISKYLQVKCQG